MTNSGRINVLRLFAWAFLALLLSLPVYAACAAYTQLSSQRGAMARSLGPPSSHDGCCAKLFVPSSAIAAQSMRQLHMRSPLVAAAWVVSYPSLRRTALSSGHAAMRAFSSRRVYALTQRLRL